MCETGIHFGGVFRFFLFIEGLGSEVANFAERTSLQTTANNTETYEQYVTKTETASTYAGTPVYYNNAAIPQGMAEIHTINYYDNYTFDLAGLTVPTTVLGQTVDTRTKTLATGSKTRVLGTNHLITTISAYDKKGRLIYTATKNPYLNTTDIVESKLDFAGKVLETKTTHIKGNNAAIVTVDKFEYDHMGRLLTQAQKINNQAEELIAENVYDALGQLEQKKVGNTKSKPLQTIDYTYNVRGWLKGINNPATLGNSLFAFRIGYNEGSNPLYNGNIALTQWKTKNQDQGLKTYNYTYDALNRIKTAIHGNNNYSLLNVNYDKNGNITALKRNGHVNAGATSFGLMDDLSYTYHNGGNFLVKVSDAANTVYGFKDGTNTDNDYARDANGNTTRDRNKGITGITYNYLNLPTQVSFGSNKIAYIYDASGVKLKKMVTQGSSVTNTEYAGNYIYENRQLQFSSHPEGYVTKENNAYKYVYQYKDHLGNVRLSYANTGSTSVPQLEIIEENNYYPFGLQHKGYNNVVNGTEYNYKTFQGQELHEDLGLNVIEFKWRTHDPVIGRFWQIDPLAEDFTYNSPYAFSENSPIAFVELEGLEKVLAIYYHGGPTGGGQPTTVDKAGYTGQYYQSTQSFAQSSGREFSGTIIAPGLTSASGVETGMNFVNDNYEAGDQVMVYGYSYGVDVAVDLTESLNEAGINVDLLVTVDGSDGPLQNTTVNTDIPENVDTNLNVYQTDNSGTSSSSRSTGASSSGTSSGSSSSNSGSSNSPGSNGGPNSAVNPSKTNVVNKNITGPGVNHGNIQQKAQNTIQPLINTRINNYPKNQN
ncbi:RHS repeat domain-containing protein [Sinomicrobium sp. M5D2P9]